MFMSWWVIYASSCRDAKVCLVTVKRYESSNGWRLDFWLLDHPFSGYWSHQHLLTVESQQDGGGVYSNPIWKVCQPQGVNCRIFTIFLKHSYSFFVKLNLVHKPPSILMLKPTQFILFEQKTCGIFTISPLRCSLHVPSGMGGFTKSR